MSEAMQVLSDTREPTSRDSFFMRGRFLRELAVSFFGASSLAVSGCIILATLS
jgi:hypothetical protein